MSMPSQKLIDQILEMSAAGMDSAAIAEDLYQSEMDSLSADAEDDSDEAIERRYCISPDDRYDSRGRELRPSVNEAGEPWWM